MAFQTGLSFLSGIDLYQTETVASQPIGQLVWDGTTGKAFRYALVSTSALVMGNLLQEQAELTTYENMVVATAASKGDQVLAITNGTSTITSAAYVGGSLSIYTAGTIALGDEYTIMGVTGTLTTGGALKVSIDRPLRAAMTTSATVNMKLSPWSNVIQAPATTQTGMAVGVALLANPASTYGWVQTHGLAAVLSDGSTFAVGSDVGTPSGTAGCVTVFAAGTTHQRVGVVRQAAASGHCISVFLQID